MGNRVKQTIFLRILTGFLAIYLALMVSFSVFLIGGKTMRRG